MRFKYLRRLNITDRKTSDRRIFRLRFGHFAENTVISESIGLTQQRTPIGPKPIGVLPCSVVSPTEESHDLRPCADTV